MMPAHFSKLKFNPWLMLIILPAIIVRAYFIAATPVEWNPGKCSLQAFNDEASHVNYVRYLLINKSLPVHNSCLKEKDAFVVNEFEYYQPPLNYIVFASAAFIFNIPSGGNTLVYFCRALSAFFGMLSILLLFYLLKKHFAGSPAIFITLIYSLLPVHIRHTSAFSNDVLLWVFVIVLLLFIHKKINNACNGNDLVLETIALCLSIWIKTSILPFIACYFLLGFIDKERRKQWLIPAACSIIFFIPYLVRNYLLYNQLLAMDIAVGPNKPFLLTMSPYIIFKFARGVLITFVFPYDTLTIPIFLKMCGYVLWTLISLRVIYVLGKISISSYRGKKISGQFVYTLFLLASILGLIYYNLNRFQPEYRMIFYNIPFLFLALAVEFSSAFSKIKKGFLLVSVALPLVLVVYYSYINL
jgi:hypothetical protein